MQDNIYNLLFHTGLILTVHKELKLTTTNNNNKNTSLIMGNRDSILGGNANQQHNEMSLL